MNAKTVGALVLACAFAVATLFVASIASDSFVHWLYTQSVGSVRLLQSMSVVATTLLIGLGVYLRRRTESRDEREP
jgi:hypothetical protein